MLRPGEYADAELYIERLTPAQDATIPSGHEKVIAHGVPKYYVDNAGAKRPIDLTLNAKVEQGHSAFGCDKNTLKSRVRADGWTRAECIDGYVEYRIASEKHTKHGPPTDILEKLPAVAVSAFTQQDRHVSTTRGNLKTTTEVLQGRIKDTICISQLPAGSSIAAPYGIVFEYASDLMPVLVGAEVHWQSQGTTVLKWEAPTGWDSLNATITLVYSIDTSANEITLETQVNASDLVFPVYFDPTTTTDQSAATANMSVYDQKYPDNDDFNSLAFIKITAPSIAGTVTAATLNLRIDLQSDTAGFDLHGATGKTWDETSTAATLKALSGFTALGSKSESATGPRAYDISAFVISEYASGTPSPFTFKLENTDEVPPNDISATARIDMGEEGAGTWAYLQFATRSDISDYPSVSITFTTSTTKTATGAATLAPLISFPLGSAVITHVATDGTPTLAALTASGASKITKEAGIGASPPTLAALTADGVSALVQINGVDGTPTLAVLTAAGTGNRTITAKSRLSTSILAPLTAAGTARVPKIETTGDVTLSGPSASGIAHAPLPSVGAAELAALTASGRSTVTPITIEQSMVITRVGYSTWKFDWSAFADVSTTLVNGSLIEVDANAPYQGWIEGKQQFKDIDSTVSQATTAIVIEGGTAFDPPVLEILESDDIAVGNSTSGQKYPPWVTLNWESVANADYYTVQQFVDAAWTDIFQIIDSGESYYTGSTLALADVTTHSFRVLSVSTEGGTSVARLINVFMVRDPETPVVTGTYVAGTGDLTIAARA